MSFSNVKVIIVDIRYFNLYTAECFDYIRKLSFFSFYTNTATCVCEWYSFTLSVVK